MVEAREEIKEFQGFNEAMRKDLKKLAFRKAKYYRQVGTKMQKRTQELIKDDFDGKSHLSLVREAFEEVKESQ